LKKKARITQMSMIRWIHNRDNKYEIITLEHIYVTLREKKKKKKKID